MPSGQHQKQDLKLEPVKNLAAGETFMRLQQHQEEFLKWLEASEKSPEMDRYVYKKIR